MTDTSNISPLDQARILSEALPHMQEYDEETIVIKYGGHAMGAEDTAKAFAPRHRAAGADRDQSGRRAWRRAADRDHARSGSASSRNSRPALRITDAATIEIVEMVLAGSVNKQLVGYINEAGGKAVGLCGKDGNMVKASKTTRTIVDPGLQYREGDRSRLRRRPRKGRPHAAQPADRPRADPGAGAARDLAGRPDAERQCRHLCRRGRRRAEGQAPAAAHRRARRARQVQEADSGAVGEGRAQS